MASTIVGKSGRVYTQGEMLRRRRNERNTFKAKYAFSLLSIARVFSHHLVRSENESFLLKHVPKSYFTVCTQYFSLWFAGTRRLRMHVDCNDEERVLVYPYFRGTLFELIDENQDLSDANRKTILRYVAEAIYELHSRNCIHLGT